MTDPLFWLVLSLLFVTISLTIVLAVAVPALREVARAARSAEKLFDTLRREFPPTLESIRLTGMEISDLSDDLSEGVQSAGQVVKQVDQSILGARKQAQKVGSGTRSVVAGVRAAWRTFTRPTKSGAPRRSPDRLSPARSEREIRTRQYTEQYAEQYADEALPEPIAEPKHTVAHPPNGTAPATEPIAEQGYRESEEPSAEQYLRDR